MSRGKLKKYKFFLINKDMKKKNPHIAILKNSSRSHDQLSDRYQVALAHFGASSEVISLKEELDDIRARFDSWDGIILTGADSNVCPRQYKNHIIDDCELQRLLQKDVYDRIRDKMSFMLLELAVENKKPLLAICRGFQEMNVFFGGGLTDDIRSLHSDTRHDFGYVNPKQREEHAHEVSIHNGGFFERFFGADAQFSVNSIHRQGVQVHQKAPQLHLEAICDEDLYVEALSYPEHPFMLGVQFHPEFKMDIPIYYSIFERFLDEAKTYLDVNEV